MSTSTSLSDFEGDGSVYDRGFVLENSGGYTQGGSSTPIDGYQGDLFPEMRTATWSTCSPIST